MPRYELAPVSTHAHQFSTRILPRTRTQTLPFWGCRLHTGTTQASRPGRSTRVFSSSLPSTGEPCCEQRFSENVLPPSILFSVRPLSFKSRTLTLGADISSVASQGFRAGRFGQSFSHGPWPCLVLTIISRRDVGGDLYIGGMFLTSTLQCGAWCTSWRPSCQRKACTDLAIALAQSQPSFYRGDRKTNKRRACSRSNRLRSIASLRSAQ